MAKDGTNRGGARAGAGAKKKPLADKIAEGNPGRRKLTVIDFQDTAERVPAGSPKTGRCTAVREHCGHGKRRKRTAAGEFQQREKPQAAKQPAMDLSRDKNAEEMKWSPLEMGAAMQAHGA